MRWVRGGKRDASVVRGCMKWERGEERWIVVRGWIPIADAFDTRCNHVAVHVSIASGLVAIHVVHRVVAVVECKRPTHFVCKIELAARACERGFAWVRASREQSAGNSNTVLSRHAPKKMARKQNRKSA
jgi:hypothetical protein